MKILLIHCHYRLPGGEDTVFAAERALLEQHGHTVVVYEKDDAIGGLMRYGIPNFKLEKGLLDRRVKQMEAEGTRFRTNVEIGKDITWDDLRDRYDAVVVAIGSRVPRDMKIPGRELDGIHFALDFLPDATRRIFGVKPVHDITAKDKHVIVIGGGDTGSDCVGTSNRHGAKSVTQFEVMPMPPEQEDKPLTWPYWPLKMRTSSSHLEGDTQRKFSIATKEFIGEKGVLKALKTVELEWKGGKMTEVAGSEKVIPADLVFLAMGFVSPVGGVLEAFGVEKDARGNAKATTDGEGCYATSTAKVFAAGDTRRGQSLVVWAIREGRQCAREVDLFLMGSTSLPR